MPSRERQGINLSEVIEGGMQGLMLEVAAAVTWLVCITVDKLLGGSGIAGAGSSTAGNAAATPNAVAAADPLYLAITPIATIQVTASVIVTATLAPILTTWMYKRVHKKRPEEAEARGKSMLFPSEPSSHFLAVSVRSGSSENSEIHPHTES